MKLKKRNDLNLNKSNKLGSLQFSEKHSFQEEELTNNLAKLSIEDRNLKVCEIESKKHGKDTFQQYGSNLWRLFNFLLITTVYLLGIITKNRKISGNVNKAKWYEDQKRQKQVTKLLREAYKLYSEDCKFEEGFKLIEQATTLGVYTDDVSRSKQSCSNAKQEYEERRKRSKSPIRMDLECEGHKKIQPGDLLVEERKKLGAPYHHVSIYVGNDRVVEFGEVINEVRQGVSRNPISKEITFNEGFNNHYKTPYSREQIVKRAVDLVNSPEWENTAYKATMNNCQHFVSWVYTDKKSSFDADFYKRLLQQNKEIFRRKPSGP